MINEDWQSIKSAEQAAAQEDSGSQLGNLVQALENTDPCLARLMGPKALVGHGLDWMICSQAL